MNAALFALMLEELMSGPTTRAELIESTGLHRDTVERVVAAMRNRGLIYIGAWERDPRGCASRAAFQIGKKADMPKPPPLTDSQKTAAYLARKDRRNALRASAGVSIQVGV